MKQISFLIKAIMDNFFRNKAIIYDPSALRTIPVPDEKKKLHIIPWYY